MSFNKPNFQKPLAAYANHEYDTPLFVLRETLAGFFRHNVFGLAASLSFYALFALIPMVLLMFFLLSQLVFSSDYAIVKLAILTGNLVPDFSNTIMLEVHKASQTKAAWGALGLFLLLWSVTPLAAALRATFHTIATKIEPPSFFKRKLKDIVSVLGILLLFFLFTSAGIFIEQIVRFTATQWPAISVNLLGGIFTLLITTLLITLFYKAFFPMRVAYTHLVLGALVTACLWLLMRYAFGLFLSLNSNYGAVFGGLKNLFVSITWLYLNFTVFLLGTELIATLRKKDVLMLKGLFDGSPNKANYLAALSQHYGKTLQQGDVIFARGNTERNLYFVTEGTVQLKQGVNVARELHAGDYFGELSILTAQPTTSDAVVTSPEAKLVMIYADHIDMMLADEPKVVMQFLKQLAGRLQTNYI